MEQENFDRLYADVRELLDKVGDNVDPELQSKIVDELNALRARLDGRDVYDLLLD